MPALEQELVKNLKERLVKHLESTGGYESIDFVDAGGSAAIFKVQRNDGLRAVKVFNPNLFFGAPAAASKRRLDVQRRLIDHKCPSLIQTYFADESQGTAIIEMEFNDWPQLSKQLGKVPDDAIGRLMGQLVDAVKYLEGMNIVHRDIKPENIHISTDFQELKLLDLGVAREFDNSDENDAAITDAGVGRPFLATAQYSSPEYLFRLDEPTDKLWKGLNFYQVGAVLHDLIKKEALFQYEILLENRWLVARAVLTKQPSFSDTDAKRLSAEKALALRCLTKDLDTRLSLVGWDEFQFNKIDDPLTTLKTKLSKGLGHLGEVSKSTSTARLAYERQEYCTRIFERVRTELIAACGTELPVTMITDYASNPANIAFTVSPEKSILVRIDCDVSWKSGVYEKSALMEAGAMFQSNSSAARHPETPMKACLEMGIGAAEDETVTAIANKVAELVGLALSRIEATGGDASTLQGTSV
ncbi:serine/threonine protein kinase [Pseudothauera nasutitermitis]|uniref:Serine/threonine protein kinase n=1 Tax=Pseudothauera nasutitermitis TaxID=2565930 RepID=A0A4S4AZN2_9RHOO|nr:protein kinase [Pseudothauera nasutitermitis]THF65621.1 serine/threonine protein kinase [Pseudothauera nasutitermitis]